MKRFQDDNAFGNPDEPRNNGEQAPKSDHASEDENFEDPVSDMATANSDNQLDALIDIPKHPLQYNWVLWYCKPERGTKWEDCMKEVITFNTVEDFWA